MKIAIGNDRKGLDYKIKLVKWLIQEGYEVIDVGTNEDKPCDYPIYAEKVALLIEKGECDRGIVICSSGIGISIAANKVNGIRCGVAYNDEVAKLMREHNDANVIAFGQSFMNYENVKKRTEIFLNTAFLGGHHLERINLIYKLEKTNRGKI